MTSHFTDEETESRGAKLLGQGPSVNICWDLNLVFQALALLQLRTVSPLLLKPQELSPEKPGLLLRAQLAQARALHLSLSL